MKLKKVPYLLFIIVTICLITSCNKECKHQSTDWIIDVEATCTENGSKHKECTKCHEKLDTEVIEALGHDLVHHEKEDPTCTNKGHKAYDTCTRCDYTTYEEIPELGHIYEDGICTRCGYELTSSDLLYELTSDNMGYIVTGLDYSKYDINALTIIIPNEYRDLPVIGIKKEAFNDREKIKKIFLPNTITYIEESAFKGCKGLKSIEIPNSVTRIEQSAFYGCNNLTSMTLPFIGNGSDKTHFGYIFSLKNDSYSSYVPASLKEVIITNATSIGEEAFRDCNGLTRIEIPNSVTSIGSRAFWDCEGLTRMEIPNSVTSTGISIFYNCTGLKNIYYKGTIEDWCNASINFFVFDEYSIMEYSGHFYMLNEYNEYEEVTKIVIPETITKIGAYQFCGFKRIVKIVIPYSVKEIGFAAFKGCQNLTSIIVDEKNPRYDSRNNCNAIIDTQTNTLILGCKNTIIPENIKSIGDSAFSNCVNLASIEIPNSVTSIGNRAFEGCRRLTRIEIPYSVTNMGYGVFSKCTNLTIYCEAPYKPSGWPSSWNLNNFIVVWGYKKK